MNPSDPIQVQQSLDYATRPDHTLLRGWQRTDGEKVVQLAGTGSSTPKDSIGREHTTPDAHGGTRDVFADWKIEGQKLNVTLYLNPTDKQSMQLDLSQPIAKIADVVASHLESGAIHPVHARAVFEAVAQAHAQAAHTAFGNMGDKVQDFVRRINPTTSWNRGGALELKSDLTALHDATNPLGKALEAVRYEEITVNAKDANKLADAIRSAIPTEKNTSRVVS